MNTNFLNLEIIESSVNFLIRLIKKKIFQFITKKSCPFFLRGDDMISIDPQIFGVHEKIVTKFIDSFSKNGYSDFFLDIGANIGLTSCQNGSKFKKVYMFEPNPLCCKILDVNCSIALNKENYNIYNYGLGNENKKNILTIPKKNWAGAFIKDELNAYSKETLAKKDQLNEYIDSNYFNLDIEIRDTKVELKNIFKELEIKKFNKGVIKIDVEGYESVILKGIANSIPANFQTIIIFENWDKNFNRDKILDYFNGRAELFKIKTDVPWKKSWPKAIKLLSFFIKGKFKTKASKDNIESWIGDLILTVNSK